MITTEKETILVYFCVKIDKKSSAFRSSIFAAVRTLFHALNETVTLGVGLALVAGPMQTHFRIIISRSLSSLKINFNTIVHDRKQAATMNLEFRWAGLVPVCGGWRARNDGGVSRHSFGSLAGQGRESLRRMQVCWSIGAPLSFICHLEICSARLRGKWVNGTAATLSLFFVTLRLLFGYSSVTPRKRGEARLADAFESRIPNIVRLNARF